jgi:hypothetical protein
MITEISPINESTVLPSSIPLSVTTWDGMRPIDIIRVINTPQEFISKICSKWQGEEKVLPRYSGSANGPYALRVGMNKFLSSVNVTFRRDHDSRRPRINKNESRKDREQRNSGDYYSYDA